ncbi:MAG: endopeptidase La [Candidatus Paraimprobicoccus trichonymphae]|uniref:Lon protease n=1 Tax=Candidatus Paraimprobicoccus trichonymphae TaxID=3033793 RepID=A0AA48I3M1_9FIRM|nr:MAG: endopeptidase La [Candidatus Paraimprobicoccus trichonymphae]
MNDKPNENKLVTVEKNILPVLILRGLVVFPNMALNFDISRKKSILAVEKAMNANQEIFVVAQKEINMERPKSKDLYDMGVVAKIRQILYQGGNILRVLIEGVKRAKSKNYFFDGEYVKSEIIICKSLSQNLNAKNKALLRKAKELFADYLSIYPKIPPDLLIGIKSIKDLGEISDYITSNIMLEYSEKQEILEELNTVKRIEKLLVFLNNELNILKIENDIAIKLKDSIDKNQKDYFLREQIRVISQELGEDDEPYYESRDYIKKIKKLNLDKDILKKLKSECDRFSKMPSGSSEASMCRSYIEECIGLPWNKRTRDSSNLEKVSEILDKNHFGLNEVKERISEILAVKKLTKNIKNQIICLVGPPGVGKTSIAKSISESLDKKFARVSLGGIKDESEIRGHRRTYIGAMPGRIISAIKKAGTKNPLVLLDEIDKLCKDYHGDPSAALLEVLDSEQNNKFLDHYIDIPFDLSEVFFITTANDKSEIPLPLYDRMEVINLYSYTYEEKFNIAKNHLIPKLLLKNGLSRRKFTIDDASIYYIIDCYTKEAGVREVERKISSIMRKAAKLILTTKNKSVNVNKKLVLKMLGPEKFKKEKINRKSEIGLVRGLAWTSVGGETMPIEVSLMKGKGKVQITGSLGDVMKESAQLAVSYIRSNYSKLGINQDFYNKTDIHIHAPEGAVQKDGPSAGVTMTTALVSALSNRPVRQDIAMTGEITLKGRVLPIGGLKEKTIAAYKAGVKTVIIPSENKNDLYNIDEKVKKSLHFIMAENLDTVFKNSLEK